MGYRQVKHGGSIPLYTESGLQTSQTWWVYHTVHREWVTDRSNMVGLSHCTQRVGYRQVKHGGSIPLYIESGLQTSQTWWVYHTVHREWVTDRSNMVGLSHCTQIVGYRQVKHGGSIPLYIESGLQTGQTWWIYHTVHREWVTDRSNMVDQFHCTQRVGYRQVKHGGSIPLYIESGLQTGQTWWIYHTVHREWVTDRSNMVDQFHCTQCVCNRQVKHGGSIPLYTESGLQTGQTWWIYSTVHREWVTDRSNMVDLSHCTQRVGYRQVKHGGSIPLYTESGLQTGQTWWIYHTVHREWVTDRSNMVDLFHCT